MRIINVFKPVLSLALILVLSSFSLSAMAVETESSEPETVNEQITHYLRNIPLNTIDTERTVLVKFMLTEKGEMLILSTSDNALDKQIKMRLNYKHLTAPELGVNTTYTIPLVFKKD